MYCRECKYEQDLEFSATSRKFNYRKTKEQKQRKLKRLRRLKKIKESKIKNIYTKRVGRIVDHYLPINRGLIVAFFVHELGSECGPSLLFFLCSDCVPIYPLLSLTRGVIVAQLTPL